MEGVARFSLRLTRRAVVIELEAESFVLVLRLQVLDQNSVLVEGRKSVVHRLEKGV